MTANRSRLLALGVAFLLGATRLFPADPASRAANPGRPYVIDFPQIIPIGEKKISTSVALRAATLEYRPGPPTLAVTVAPTNGLKLSLDIDFSTVASVSWYKDAKPLGVTTPVLEIASAAATDAGIYGARVMLVDPKAPVAIFEPLVVRVVEPPWKRLFNLSTRATLSAAQRFFISGFVISEPGASVDSGKLVLIRAIGPSLSSYGIADALAAPELHVYRASGDEVFPMVRPAVFPDTALEQIVAKAGAFPVPRLTKDITALFELPADVYSAKVSSADGGTGTVLLEIYEVPN